MAQLWSNYAWQGRGGEYADNVTPEQWRLLAERLEKASSYMKELDPESDPHAYLVLMGIALGKSRARRELDILYDRAVHSNPRYFHYYPERAVALMERWFGRKDELANYVQSILEQPGGEDGQVAYSYIALRLMQRHGRDELFEKTGLSWPHVRAAYATRGRVYGLRSRDWNALCKMALAVPDVPAAKEALQHIGSDWDPAVWREKKYFDAAAAWIRSK
jgi:hypothetical protein